MKYKFIPIRFMGERVRCFVCKKCCRRFDATCYQVIATASQAEPYLGDVYICPDCVRYTTKNEWENYIDELIARTEGNLEVFEQDCP